MQTVSFTVNIVIGPGAPAPLTKNADPVNVSGNVGSPLSFDVLSNVSGGVAPLSAQIVGTPPPGLSVSGSVIAGTPQAEGTTTLSVTVNDSSQ